MELVPCGLPDDLPQLEVGKAVEATQVPRARVQRAVQVFPEALRPQGNAVCFSDKHCSLRGAARAVSFRDHALDRLPACHGFISAPAEPEAAEQEGESS